jgi:hypothetical protein
MYSWLQQHRTTIDYFTEDSVSADEPVMGEVSEQVIRTYILESVKTKYGTLFLGRFLSRLTSIPKEESNPTR